MLGSRPSDRSYAQGFAIGASDDVGIRRKYRRVLISTVNITLLASLVDKVPVGVEDARVEVFVFLEESLGQQQASLEGAAWGCAGSVSMRQPLYTHPHVYTHPVSMTTAHLSGRPSTLTLTT